jgi:hypothetical protein
MYNIFSFVHSLIVLYRQQNDITGYAPFGARARTEVSRYQEFFSKDGPGVTVYIFALAKDGGSMLREEYLNETIEVRGGKGVPK